MSREEIGEMWRGIWARSRLASRYAESCALNNRVSPFDGKHDRRRLSAYYRGGILAFNGLSARRVSSAH